MAAPMYGLDKELADKAAEKYDHELEKAVTGWIIKITGEDFDSKGADTFAMWLQDGQVLCNLVNKIFPGRIKKVNTMMAPFKKMENITRFTDAARAVGVPEASMFATPDLYEEKNLGSVVMCIYQFAQSVQSTAPHFRGPKLGDKIEAQVVHDAGRERQTATQMGGLSGALQKEIQATGQRDRAPPAQAGGFQARSPSPSLRQTVSQTGGWSNRAPPAHTSGRQNGAPPAQAGGFQSRSPSPSRSTGPPLRQTMSQVSQVSQVSQTGGWSNRAPPAHTHGRDRGGAPPAQAGGVMARSQSQGPSRSPSPSPRQTATQMGGQSGRATPAQAGGAKAGEAAEVCGWIEAVTGERRGGQTMAEWLKSGVVLCKLANAIKPGSVTGVKDNGMPFNQMENIKKFLGFARNLGMNESYLFSTPDLFEEKNMSVVVKFFYAFGGFVQAKLPQYRGPTIGVAVKAEVSDVGRNIGLITDQSTAFQGVMERDRPKYKGIIR